MAIKVEINDGRELTVEDGESGQIHDKGGSVSTIIENNTVVFKERDLVNGNIKTEPREIHPGDITGHIRGDVQVTVTRI